MLKIIAIIVILIIGSIILYYYLKKKKQIYNLKIFDNTHIKDGEKVKIHEKIFDEIYTPFIIDENNKIMEINHEVNNEMNNGINYEINYEIENEVNHEVNRIEFGMPGFYGDAQNVHDHITIDSIKNNIQKMETSNTDITTIKLTLINKINNDTNLTVNTRNNYCDLIASSNDTILDSLKISPNDALKKIYNDVIGNDNTYDIFKLQLGDCFEHGNKVCQTGITAKILGTLDGIKTENIQYSHTLRKELLDKASKEYRDYTGDNFAEHFKNKMSDEYRESNISHDVLIDEINKWINDI